VGNFREVPGSRGGIMAKRIQDVSREEYFSIPVETGPLYLIDYKRREKIVRIPAGSQDK
jgi:hypothetical protein